MRALIEFYDAFNNRDLDKMSKNWAQTDEIAMDNPLGGIKRGWDKIRAVYERIFNGPAKVYVEFYDYTMHEAGEIFYAVGRERGDFRIGDTIIPLAIRTTRIYRLINGWWRQVHHHGSIDDPELLAHYQSAVRQDHGKETSMTQTSPEVRNGSNFTAASLGEFAGLNNFKFSHPALPFEVEGKAKRRFWLPVMAAVKGVK